MRLKITFILILINFIPLFCQLKKIEGYVLDTNTLSPLSYATIGCLNKNYGCYTDTSGYFCLYYSEIEDSIKISYLGYRDINISVNDLLKDSLILINPEIFSINEIVIRPDNAKYKIIELGYYSKKYDFLKAINYPINIYAVHIPHPAEEKELILNTVNIGYIKRYVANNYPMRVVIYKVDKNGKPGEVIFTENIQTKNSKPSKVSQAIVDVSNKQLYLPDEGIYVAVEWLVNFNPGNNPLFGPYLGLNRTNYSNIFYIKTLNQENWHKIRNKRTLTIGITVKKYD